MSKNEDSNLSVYFIDFINEAARVIKERKECEQNESGNTKSKN